jgi:hypothetical protein
MLNQRDNQIRYKWDPKTSTGFQLRFDAEAAANGGHYCYHVEDWTCRTVTNEWQCQTLDEALGVLNRLFTIDVEQERRRLGVWPQAVELQAAA